MKRYRVYVTGIFFLCMQAKLMSQAVIKSYPLSVATNKTSNLIFPYAIKSVDRGSPDIVTQKAAGVENVLQVKAAKQAFPVTSLSVITADGKLYSFLVCFDSNPKMLNLSFTTGSSIADPVIFDSGISNEAMLDSNARQVLHSKCFLNRSVCDDGVMLILQSIHVDNGLLWFRFHLHNYSLIEFKPGYIKFFMGDNRRVRRTAQQEMELTPVYRIAANSVKGKESTTLVFAFPLFTLPKDRRMVCQVSEQNGGRLLLLHVSHNIILKARLLH